MWLMWCLLSLSCLPCRVYPGLIERIAYGHILFGYMQCQPAYMQMAMRLLKHLQSCSEVTVAMAMCQLLLGNVHNSLELLKQAEAMTPRYAPPIATHTHTQALAWSSRTQLPDFHVWKTCVGVGVPQGCQHGPPHQPPVGAPGPRVRGAQHATRR